VSANGSLPYRKLHPSDRLATHVAQGWTLEQLGAHEVLLDIAWINGGIPADAGERAARLRITAAAEAAIWNAIGAEWVPKDDGLLTTEALEAERGEAERSYAKRVRAGRIAGRASAEKRRNESSTNRQPTRTTTRTRTKGRRK
jgi:uncharacterized protein YdaU (DUF1376 family)